jgi:hypothetical protein
VRLDLDDGHQRGGLGGGLRAHAYSYPPRHRFTWIFSWVVTAILLGIGVAALPGQLGRQMAGANWASGR